LIELIYCTCICILAIGFGLRVLRWVGATFDFAAEELCFALGLGFGGLAFSVMLLGFFHVLYEATLYILLLVFLWVGNKGIIVSLGRLPRLSERLNISWRTFHFWLAILIALGLLINLTRALTPVHGAVDPLAYHLALPKLYLQKHYLSFEPTVTGTLYPGNIPMLYTLAIGVRGGELAQLLHFTMGMASLVFTAVFCRTYFDVKVGIWAAAFFSFTPVLVFFAPLGYIDVGVSFFVFLAAWALFNWLERRDEGALKLAGIMVGLALGTKYSAVPIALVGAGLIFVTSLFKKGGETPKVGLRRTAFFVALALLLVSPWYIRAMVEAGNPVWPLANEIFAGEGYKESFRDVIIDELGEQAVVDPFVPSADRLKEVLYLCGVSLWNWSWTMGDMQRAIGIYIVAFLPGVFIYARQRRIVLIILFCLAYYLLVVVYVHGNPRYSIFLFAFLSIVAGYVAERLTSGSLRRWRWAVQFVVVVSIVCNLGRSFQIAYNSGAISYLLSDSSKDQFLVEREGNYRVFRAVDRQLPKSAVVLLQGIVKGYYCDRSYLWDHPYQEVINYYEYDTPDKLYQRMQALGISHIVRMMHIPDSRLTLGYPQYFTDAKFHEAFRKKYLKLIYRDESYVLFQVQYPS